MVCSCGASLDVPPLRQLRELPLTSTTDVGTQPVWSVRQGAIAANLILALLLAASAGIAWYKEPSLPKFEPQAYTRFVENRVANSSPAEGWKMWVDSYLPLARTGVQEFQNINTQAIQRQIDRRRFFEMMMLIAAGVFVAAAAGFAVWRG